MKINEIVDLALTYQFKDKLTKQVYTQKPRFDYLDNILYIHTPVVPYKLVVLRRLLYVSSYNVALYDYNVNTRSSLSLQDIVNNEDSAASYRNKGRLVIADHNYQGFDILAYLTEGSTAYIQFEDGSTIGYTLIKKSKIKFSLIVNNISPKANKIPPSNITNLELKKWPTIPPKKQKILIANDVNV